MTRTALLHSHPKTHMESTQIPRDKANIAEHPIIRLMNSQIQDKDKDKRPLMDIVKQPQLLIRMRISRDPPPSLYYHSTLLDIPPTLLFSPEETQNKSEHGSHLTIITSIDTTRSLPLLHYKYNYTFSIIRLDHPLGIYKYNHGFLSL